MQPSSNSLRIKRKSIFYCLVAILTLGLVTPVLADYLGPDRTVTEVTSVSKVILYECQYVPLAKSAIYLALFVGFAYAYYVRYFLFRNCFNELGRCYDPDGSGQIYTTSGQVWALPAVVFLVLGAKNIYQLLRTGRNHG